MSVAGGPKLETDGLILALDASNIRSYDGEDATTTWTDISKRVSGGRKNATINSRRHFHKGTPRKKRRSFDLLTSDHFMTIPNVFEIGTGSFTIQFNCRSNFTSDFQYLLTNKDNFDGPFIKLGFDDTGKLRFYTEESGGSNSVFVTDSVYADNNFMTVTFTRTGATGKIYVNGILVKTGTTKSGGIGNSSNNWLIGVGDSSGTQPFKGQLSSIRVYNRELTSLEIFNNYFSTKSAEFIITDISTYTYLGQNYGFNASPNGVDRFPFASDTNATDVGDLAQGAGSGASHHSDTHAYQTSGGTNGTPTSSGINKFPVATTGFTATNIGDLTQARYASNGTHSETHGYTSGGNHTPSSTPAAYLYESNVIDKYPFASDTNASDVGNLISNTGSSAAGCTDDANSKGYHCGGMWPRSNTIQVYSFASDGNASDTGGNIYQAMNFVQGNASSSHGYVSGGRNSPSDNGDNRIGKFSFASVSNTSDVGDLTQSMAYGAGHDAASHGYISGGRVPRTTPINTIQKFPFASDTNASDVGDLTTTRSSLGKGTQI